MNRARIHTLVPRKGFTLVEVLVAGVIAAFVLGSVATSLAQLGKAKSIGKERLDKPSSAHLVGAWVTVPRHQNKWSGEAREDPAVEVGQRAAAHVD